MKPFTLKKLVLACALSAVAAAAAASQDYPNRPVRIIAPFPAGSTPDALARIVSEALAEKIGQPVIVENRPGAGGMIGARVVADSKGDGNTLLIHTPAWTTAKIFMKNPLVPAPEGLKPVTLVAEGPFALTAAGAFPPNNFDEFVSYAQANPGVVNYATVGLGDNFLYMNLMQHKRDFDMEAIQYKGSGEYIAAMLVNDVQVAITPQYSMLPFVQEGKLKILAVSGEKRSEVYPDVKTFGELGLPEIRNNWFGLFASPATPDEMIEKLNADLVEVIQSDAVSEKIRGIYFEPAGTSAKDFSERIVAEIDEWTELAKAVGIEPQ